MENKEKDDNAAGHLNMQAEALLKMLGEKGYVDGFGVSLHPGAEKVFANLQGYFIELGKGEDHYLLLSTSIRPKSQKEGWIVSSFKIGYDERGSLSVRHMTTENIGIDRKIIASKSLDINTPEDIPTRFRALMSVSVKEEIKRKNGLKF